jgi:branched-chain amino acid transport system permease protein
LRSWPCSPLSLDLILGYAGIVSLGHAAFFGFGAYAAALFAKLVMPDPLAGLAGGDRRGGAAGRWSAASPSCAAPI